MGQTAVVKEQIVSVDAKSLLANNTAVATACQAVSWATASTGDVLTVQSNGTVAFAAVSAGIGGSTGSTDNLVLRADGAGGATLQNSGWLIPDIYTSSPNATVNHLSLQATGSSTNVSVSIVPKGSGAFSLAVPDGTTAGGNARGANAVDLRTDTRSAAANVASGTRSFLGPGGTAATGTDSVAFSAASATGARSAAFANAVASGSQSFAATEGTASAERSVCFSYAGTASGAESFACGPVSQAQAYGSFASGLYAIARIETERNHSCGRFAADGDCTHRLCILRGTTTTNSAVELLGGLARNIRCTIPSGYILHGILKISGARNGGGAVADYLRQVTIKNVAGSTSLVGTVNTIGTDEAAGTSISITADDTNDALKIEATGVSAETWRWQAIVECGLYAYGT
jgi:hypothetical protein